MKFEVGSLYATRDGDHVVRIISLVGKWSKKHPIVAELYRLEGKRKVFEEGMFTQYEHFTKKGHYISDDVEAGFDIVAAYAATEIQKSEAGSGEKQLALL